jgi:hypothetical protein
MEGSHWAVHERHAGCLWFVSSWAASTQAAVAVCQHSQAACMTAISAHADSPTSCTSVTGKHMPVCMCMAAACCSCMGATARCIMWAFGGCSPLVCQLLVGVPSSTSTPHITQWHTHQTKHPHAQCHTPTTRFYTQWLGSLICCLCCWLLRRAVWLWHAKALSMRPGHCCGGQTLRKGCASV